MPIAAVPRYLGTDFATASPGLRFGMYLKLWGVNNRSKELLWTTHDINYRVAGRDRQERAFHDENKRAALDGATALTPADRVKMAELHARQQSIAETLPAETRLTLRAESVAPFTTGLGNEHPLENGFSFLNPYGLPYLPGSGVKGVLRQAARELAGGDWGETCGWSEDEAYTLMQGEGEKRKPVVDQRTRTPVKLSMLDVLFGLESGDRDRSHVRGALSFWDVVPQIKGDSLMVEIMTPHQGHYYQWKKDAGGNPIEVAPHDSGSPNPISFLTVPPGAAFTFIVTCDTTHLRRLAGELIETAAFEHAFDWCGFGAKTAVGYGAMERDRSIEDQRRKAEQAKAEERAREEEERRRREAEAAEAARRQAEFDVLPEDEKALRQLMADLNGLEARIPLGKDRYGELAGLLNRFADNAMAWESADARNRAPIRLLPPQKGRFEVPSSTPV